MIAVKLGGMTKVRVNIVTFGLGLDLESVQVLQLINWLTNVDDM